MRTLAKRIAERALIASGVASAVRASKRGDVLILAYHNVIPAGDPIVGDTSLHLPIGDFASHLDALSESHEVVALTKAFARGAPTTSAEKPRVVITFDDAYAGALTVALPELVRRGMPATVFVAPGLIGNETWWDRVADPKVGAVPAALRDRLLVELKGEGRAIMRSQLPNAEPTALRDAYRIGSESQIVAAASLPGITVGSHTWSHSNLASLDLARIDDELRASRDWLRERTGSFIPWLSYPYGLFSPDVERIASDLRYDGSLMVDGGWLGARTRAPHRVPRFNVPARISVDGFRLRLSGLGAT